MPIVLLREIPESTLPWACTCLDIPPDPDAEDYPCASCCAWTADIVRVFKERGSDDRAVMRAELDRVVKLVQQYTPDLEWSDEIDRTFYNRFVARTAKHWPGRNVGEFDPNVIWAHTGGLFRIAIARHALSTAGIDWRADLLRVLPFTWYEYLVREEGWATVGEILTLPAIEMAPPERAKALDDEIRWGTLAEAGWISSDLQVTSHAFSTLLSAISEAGLERVLERARQVLRVENVKDAGDYTRPLQIGRCRDAEGQALFVFAHYGKDGERAKSLVLDVARLEAALRAVLGGLADYAPARLVRECDRKRDLEPSKGVAPAEGAHLVRFCDRGLLDPAEDGDTVRWVVEAVQAANP